MPNRRREHHLVDLSILFRGQEFLVQVVVEHLPNFMLGSFENL